ncbi:putative gustatory receptor 89a, partial [Musca vetustissima]|uniref:putative gustatory receptor 89a n=1 Tax=Musca vetustissima TaxID=27455 RepID=UPI002AB62618
MGLLNGSLDKLINCDSSIHHTGMEKNNMSPRHLRYCAESSTCDNRPPPLMAKLRHLWNKIFFGVIRVMIFCDQVTLLAPFVVERRKSPTGPSRLHFRTHRVFTGVAVSFCVGLILVTPFLAKIIPDLYDTSRSNQDTLFKRIAQFTMLADVVGTLLIMSAQIWHRNKLVEILNSFVDITEKIRFYDVDFISFKTFLALMVKVGLTCYDLLMCLPFLFTGASRLSGTNICAFVALVAIQHLTSIFGLAIFTAILGLLTLSLQLERQLANFENISSNLKMLRLITLQNALQRLIALFVNTLQSGIFIMMLIKFITILCNIYAFLDYYVTTDRVYTTFIMYLISVSLELYSIILMAYLCERSQRKVRDLFLNREEQYFLKMPKIYQMVETSVLWPQIEKFSILNLFILHNDFALFLVAYSINFLVIILEFEITKA